MNARLPFPLIGTLPLVRLTRQSFGASWHSSSEREHSLRPAMGGSVDPKPHTLRRWQVAIFIGDEKAKFR